MDKPIASLVPVVRTNSLPTGEALSSEGYTTFCCFFVAILALFKT